MDCLVTAGPTFEPLDGARRITNFSTGRLGCELAGHLTDHGHRVHLLLGEQATWHGRVRAASITRFSTGADLASKLEALADPQMRAVFHAAAVSDFRFGQVWRRGPEGELIAVTEGKFSTQSGTLLAELLPTPKILSHLREWFPEAAIFGWKYEVEPGRDRVLDLARTQILHNRTNGCVANGPGYGEGFGIVTPDGAIQHVENSVELFNRLEELGGKS